MSRAVLQRGAVGGLMGGIVMAMWSMIVLWMTGFGFWTPLNLIAHAVWRDAPLDAAFSWGGLIIGMVVHMMMSIILGLALAAILAAIPRLLPSPMASTAVGLGFGLVVWLIAQYGIWPVIDSAAAEAFTPWVFAIAHLMYGAIAAIIISVPSARHAEVQTAR